MRPFIKNIGIFIGAMVLLALIANVVRTSKEEVRTVSLSELATSIQQKSVKKIEVMNSDLAITATDGKKMVSRKEVG